MEDMEIKRLKGEMRKILKKRLRENTGRTTASIEVCNKLRSLPIFQNADVILAFAPMHSEIDITPLYDERFLFPYIEDGVMKYSPAPLEKGRMGFSEPSMKLDTSYSKAVILVPALAFSKDFRRLGRGGGFYDRYLSENRDRLYSIGLSFDLNLLDVVPYDHHDELLDMIITESKTLTRPGQK